MYKILILNNFGILFQAVTTFDPQNIDVNFIGASCIGEACKIGKGWFYDSLNERVKWLMEEGQWTQNTTQLKITVELTDSEDPPVLKVRFITYLTHNI